MTQTRTIVDFCVCFPYIFNNNIPGTFVRFEVTFSDSFNLNFTFGKIQSVEQTLISGNQPCLVTAVNDMTFLQDRPSGKVFINI